MGKMTLEEKKDEIICLQARLVDQKRNLQYTRRSYEEKEKEILSEMEDLQNRIIKWQKEVAKEKLVPEELDPATATPEELKKLKELKEQEREQELEELAASEIYIGEKRLSDLILERQMEKDIEERMERLEKEHEESERKYRETIKSVLEKKR